MGAATTSGFSTELTEAAAAVRRGIEMLPADKWTPVRAALLASALYEALRQERRNAQQNGDDVSELDLAIARCCTAATHPERLRADILAITDDLLGAESSPAPRPQAPQLRLIQGGLSAAHP